MIHTHTFDRKPGETVEMLVGRLDEIMASEGMPAEMTSDRDSEYVRWYCSVDKGGVIAEISKEGYPKQQTDILNRNLNPPTRRHLESDASLCYLGVPKDIFSRISEKICLRG